MSPAKGKPALSTPATKHETLDAAKSSKRAARASTSPSRPLSELVDLLDLGPVRP